MKSGGNKLNYFPENKLTKLANFVQFIHTGLQDIVAERRLRMAGHRLSHAVAMSSGCHLDRDQPITPCHGPLVVVTDDEVVQRTLGGLHLGLKKTWWTEESIGTASGLWLQTEADGELLLPIVLPKTGRSKC